VRCRFPSVRPAPRKGWFFQLQVPRAAADADGDPPVSSPWNSASPGNSVYLITDVELMWEEKGYRKYSITGKRWASLGTAGETRIIDEAGAVEATPGSNLVGKGTQAGGGG